MYNRFNPYTPEYFLLFWAGPCLIATAPPPPPTIFLAWFGAPASAVLRLLKMV